MLNKTPLILLTITLFSVLSNASNQIVINDTADVYEISSHVHLYIDSTTALPLRKIMDKPFREVTRSIPNIGFTHSAVWLHFDLTDISEHPREWILDIAMPSLHRVFFYILDGDSLKKTGKAGFLVDKFERITPYRNPSIELPLTKGEQLSVYIKIQGEASIITPVYLREKNHYIAYDRLREFFLGLYFGALLILALYNFYVFLSLRDFSYLWLSLFIFTFGLGQMTAVYGFLADWGFRSLHVTVPWLHIINYGAAIFGGLVTRIMLQAKRYAPKSDLAIKAYIAVLFVIMPFSPLLSFKLAEQILLSANLIPLPFYYIAAIVSLKKGHRPSVFYLIAVSTFITGNVYYILMYGFDIFPFNTFTYFLPNMSFVVMMVLFSLGLADMINTLKNEREKAQQQALHDLNEKVRLQEEKSVIENELEQARKMETIGRLLSGVSHDMKNFLVPVLGYANLLRRGCRNTPQLHQQATRLVNATHRLKDLATTLVDVSRKKTLDLSTIDLNDLIEKTASLLKHSAPPNINVKVNHFSADLPIMAEESMVCSAVLNIGINAVDAMPEGGVVTITNDITHLPPEHHLITKFNISAGDFAVITITDTGCGIDDDVLKHLFDPFFTSGKKGKGTGLGLASVYNCIIAHNGCIEVSSKTGEGSSFQLYFPIDAVKIHEIEKVNKSTPNEYDNGVLNIVCIDDDPEILSVLSDMLNELAWKPICFSSPAEAIDYLGYKGISIDCILLDFKMQEMDGLKCLKAIRAIYHSLPVIMVTSGIPENHRAAFEDLQVSAFIKKPFDLDTLSEIIKQNVQGVRVR